MLINMKVVGKDLYKRLNADLVSSTSSFPKKFQQEPIEWAINYLGNDPSAEDLVSFPDFPCVILVEFSDSAFMEKIHEVDKKMRAFIKGNLTIPLMASPIIVVFSSHEALEELDDLPDFVSDWTYSPIIINELIHRIYSCLKRKRVLKTRLHYGSLTLIPESRSVCYEDRTVRLTPSEFTLAELFLSQLGAVISIKDLVSFFKASGKSAEANNIRVAVFQLRLKIEMLTKSHIMLVSVYRQGYCMRQKASRMISHGAGIEHVMRNKIL